MDLKQKSRWWEESLLRNWENCLHRNQTEAARRTAGSKRRLQCRRRSRLHLASPACRSRTCPRKSQAEGQSYSDLQELALDLECLDHRDRETREELEETWWTAALGTSR